MKRITIGVLFGGLIVAAILGGFAIGNDVGHQEGLSAGYQYGIDAASEESSEIKQELEETKNRYYLKGYNDGCAACPIPTPCSYGIDNCGHMLIIAELIHGIAYESGGEDIETELWDFMRYQLKEEMENEGMSEVSEKEWNCFYCDMVGCFAVTTGYDAPQDIEQHCEDWGEGVCYVVDDVVVFGGE